MIAIAWAAKAYARQIGRTTLSLHDGQAATTRAAIAATAKRHDLRRLVRGVAIALFIVIAIAFIAYADHARGLTGCLRLCVGEAT